MKCLLSAFRTISKRIISKMLENIKLIPAILTSISICRHNQLLYSKIPLHSAIVQKSVIIKFKVTAMPVMIIQRRAARPAECPDNESEGQFFMQILRYGVPGRIRKYDLFQTGPEGPGTVTKRTGIMWKRRNNWSSLQQILRQILSWKNSKK